MGRGDVGFRKPERVSWLSADGLLVAAGTQCHVGRQSKAREQISTMRQTVYIPAKGSSQEKDSEQKQTMTPGGLRLCNDHLRLCVPPQKEGTKTATKLRPNQRAPETECRSLCQAYMWEPFSRGFGVNHPTVVSDETKKHFPSPMTGAWLAQTRCRFRHSVGRVRHLFDWTTGGEPMFLGSRAPEDGCWEYQ